MSSVDVKYLNLKLKNPIIVASSGLTKSADKVKACEDAGAGAVVLKSLFEEVLARKNIKDTYELYDHPEVYEYLNANMGLVYGSSEYCRVIEDSKKATSIPVIASINCISANWWYQYAKQIEDSGADAIELNIFSTATSRLQTSDEMERMYFEILANVKSKVKIPIAVKIGKYFSSLPNFVSNLEINGANGVVMFNRFTEPDIDIDTFTFKPAFSMSTKEEMYLPLRWIAIVHRQVKLSLAASTGVKTYEDIIKLVLAGASAVQIASVIYTEGLPVIRKMLDGIDNWMKNHQIDNLTDLKGSLSFVETSKGVANHYLRAQFIEKISDIE